MGNLPDLKRRQIAVAASIVAAILLAAAAHRMAGELALAPRFASPDAVEVVRAHFTGRHGCYWGLAERACTEGLGASARPERGARPH